MDSVKQGVEQAREKAAAAADSAAATLDAGLSGASAATKSTVAAAAHTVQDLLQRGCELWDTAKAHTDATLGRVEQLQDDAFDALRGGVKTGLEYCAQYPYVAYPAAATVALTAVPGVRRLAYRLTLGRLRNPEAVVASAEAKLTGVAARSEEFAAESKKLQERAQLAAEEMSRGYGKLKAARQELQRLESSVAKSERLTHNVLNDLRSMRQNPRATELRSEAALKLSLLRQQRAAIAKEIRWITKRDV